MTISDSDAHWPVCNGDDGDLDHWLGRHDDAMATCRRCGRVSVVAGRQMDDAGVEAVEDEAPAGRRSRGSRGSHFLVCCRCGSGIWLHSARPRLPLCERCRQPRARRAREHRIGMGSGDGSEAPPC